jgi:predicted ribosomally synthesized peptide with SipW-like signal peptide
MRALCLLFLVAFLGAVGAFAYFNQQEVSLRMFNWSMTASLALVAGVAYLLGMLSGWTVVGLVRKSVERVTTQSQYGYPRSV